MRSTSLLLALVLAASAAPTALGSASSLVLEMREGALVADSTVPVNVTLTIHDFMCSEPRAFTVLLYANATEGVKATFARTSLLFTTDARTYFAESFQQTQTVNLTVRALQAGDVELTAHFPEADRGPCLAPDGFQPSMAMVRVRVDAPTAAPPAATPPPPSTDNATTTENVTNATSPTPPPTPTAPRERGSGAPTTCAPDTQCGFIGEFDTPAESQENDTPSVGLVGVAAAFAVAAFVSTRRKR